MFCIYNQATVMSTVVLTYTIVNNTAQQTYGAKCAHSTSSYKKPLRTLKFSNKPKREYIYIYNI